MLSNPLAGGDLPEGAQTMEGDEAFGGFDDTGPRPDFDAGNNHTESMQIGNPNFGIARGGPNGLDSIGFQGTDPYGDGQVQTQGMITRFGEEAQ